MISRYIHKLSSGLTAGKENVIKEAISNYLGHDDWSIKDMTGRCSWIVVPDGSEIFTLDGVQLIRFFPVITAIDHDAIGMSITVTENYKLLY